VGVILRTERHDAHVGQTERQRTAFGAIGSRCHCAVAALSPATRTAARVEEVRAHRRRRARPLWWRDSSCFALEALVMILASSTCNIAKYSRNGPALPDRMAGSGATPLCRGPPGDCQRPAFTVRAYRREHEGGSALRRNRLQTHQIVGDMIHMAASRPSIPSLRETPRRVRSGTTRTVVMPSA